MAPEYAMHGQFSIKSDVFSFGVLVLEIISGQKNSTSNQSDSAADLLSRAWKLWTNGAPLELLDPTLVESYSRNEVLRCIHIGLMCVQEDHAVRPPMSSVVLMLNSFTVTLPTSVEPPFLMRGQTEFSRNVLLLDSTVGDPDKSANSSIPMSINEVSVSEIDPR